MNLFATAAFLEGSLFWIYFAEPYICLLDSFNIYYLVSWPHSTNLDTQELYLSLFTWVQWIGCLKAFFWTASMVFNVCICADLVLMIKHPFASKQSRIIKYHIYSYTFGVMAAIEFYDQWDQDNFLGVI